MKAKLAAAIAAAGLALGLIALWGPIAGRRAQALENKAERAIAAGEVQVSAAEVATLMRNRQLAVAIFDLRDEAAFNQFHLADAKRGVHAIGGLPDKTVKLLVGADDDTALAAYRTLARAGVKQVYVLAGGIPAWLALFAPPEHTGALLAGAMGGRHPSSFPDLDHVTLPKFEPKVKVGSAAKKASGGCGG